MLRKTCAAGSLLLGATVGALTAVSPASANAPMYRGGCCASHSSSHQFSGHRNRNWSGNEGSNLNRVRLRLHNRNNNIATAGPRRGNGLNPDLGLGIPGVDEGNDAGDGGGGNDGGGGGGNN